MPRLRRKLPIPGQEPAKTKPHHRIEEIVERRTRLIDDVQRLRTVAPAQHSLLGQAATLLRRTWAQSDWAARERLLDHVQRLVDLETGAGNSRRKPG